jgi:YVTN family beta-propeller protein
MTHDTPKPLLLVCNKHADTMSFVDPESLDILETIPTGPNPHEIAVTPDQRTAYLSNYAPPGDTVSVIDLVGRRHIKQIPTGEFTRIHGAYMAPDGRHAYFTAGQTGYVVEVDTKTNVVTRGIPTHGEISHMVIVSPDDTQLFTANIGTRDVSVLDRVSGELITKVPCGDGVEMNLLTPDGKRLWACNQDESSITVIDVETHEIVETIPCPGLPVRVTYTSDGATAFVASWADAGDCVVFDVPSSKEIARIPVGRQAIGIAISPDERRVFVGCEHTDGVHVIDVATLSVEAKIMTGDGSDAMAIWFPPAQ